MMLFLCLPLSISIIRASDPPPAVLTLPLLQFHTHTREWFVHGSGSYATLYAKNDKVTYRKNNGCRSVTYTHTRMHAPTLLEAHTLGGSGGREIFPLGALRCDMPLISDALFGGRCRSEG